MARARRQHDVATRRCAAECGVAVRTFDRVRRRQGWPSPFPGTAVLPGGDPRAPLTRIAAAALSVGPPVVVGGVSALFVHGLVRGPEKDVLLWVPSRRNPSDMPGRRIRRGELVWDDVVEVSGLPVLRPAAALADVVTVWPARRLRDIAVSARFAGLLEPGELEAVVHRDPHLPGRADLREVAAWLAGDGSDSGFEARARERLRDAGLDPSPAPYDVTTPTGRRSIDIAFPDERLGIECVGFAYHSSRQQLDRDALRQNEIAALGDWVVLQLTWSMLEEPEWSRFVAQVRALLRERRTPGSGAP